VALEKVIGLTQKHLIMAAALQQNNILVGYAKPAFSPPFDVLLQNMAKWTRN
jgi:hypothetical protein